MSSQPRTDIFDVLAGKLSGGRVFLPGDEEYLESLERWSVTCVKPAVSIDL